LGRLLLDHSGIFLGGFGGALSRLSLLLDFYLRNLSGCRFCFRCCFGFVR
jgi:hypothetical protein